MKIIHPFALVGFSVLAGAYGITGSSATSVVTSVRLAAPRALASNLSVTPTSLTFGPTPLNSFVYATVSIANTGDAADWIVTATSSDGAFFPTFGGSCNFSVDPAGDPAKNYWIPPGFSCTFQWGYHPTKPVGGKPPWVHTGTGTLFFENHAPISISLTGVATPH